MKTIDSVEYDTVEDAFKKIYSDHLAPQKFKDDFDDSVGETVASLEK
jgi:hypothetical protein